MMNRNRKEGEEGEGRVAEGAGGETARDLKEFMG